VRPDRIIPHDPPGKAGRALIGLVGVQSNQFSARRRTTSPGNSWPQACRVLHRRLSRPSGLHRHAAGSCRPISGQAPRSSGFPSSPAEAENGRLDPVVPRCLEREA